jgi:hypothetical protein
VRKAKNTEEKPKQYGALNQGLRALRISLQNFA